MVYLSICIPTYNRSRLLVETINSIINEPEFINSDQIEIVVSDNCSSDETPHIMQSFLKRFPDKIKYNRNKENIKDRNFEKVLNLGTGMILKLNNDTLLLKKGSLGKMLAVINYCIENELIPFFSNARLPESENRKVLSNKESFIASVSYWCTWIGSFSISKKALDNLNDFSDAANYQLVQVDVLMRLLESNCKFIVINDNFSTSVAPPIKGGYNLTEVFITNYFKLLKKYLITKEEIRTFKKEKDKTLYKFLLPSFLDIYGSINNTEHVLDFRNDNYKAKIIAEFSWVKFIIFEIKLFYKIKILHLKALTKAIFR